MKLLSKQGVGISFRRFILTMVISAALGTVIPLEQWNGSSNNAFQISSAFAQSPGGTALMVNGSSAPITVAPGSTITLSVQNGPGAATDCVTVDFTDFRDWVSSGFQHKFFAWVTGSTMTWSVSMPSSPGPYVARYWQGCATELAISPTVTVQSSLIPSLTVNGSSVPITVSPSATITVGVQNGSGTGNDCVTFDLASVVNNSAHLGFAWVTGSTATLPFTMPSAAGAYAIRYWQGCTTQMAISPTVTVALPPPGPVGTLPPPSTKPSLTLNGTPATVTVAPGSTITINVVNPTGNPKDWIGIYLVGQSSGSPRVVEHYVAGTSYTIPITTPTGTYEARLFANDSLTLLATSAPITVSTGTPTSHPTMTGTLLGQTGEDLVGTYSEGPDGIKDVHLQLSGVSGIITGVRITGPGLDGIWQTPANGQNWIVGIKPQSNPSVVDLYIDFYKPITSYNLTVTFSDGATQALASTPAPASDSPPPPPPPPPSTSGCSTSCYYVATNGSDSNPGTPAQPWRTITKASTTLSAGQTAVVMDGIYEEGALYFRRGGLSVAPITILAQNKGQAILSSLSGCTASINIYASYITIQDMRLSVSPSEPMPSGCSTANFLIHAWNQNEPTPSNPTTENVGFTVRGTVFDYSSHRNGAIKNRQDHAVIENNVFNDEVEDFKNDGTIIRNNLFNAYPRDWVDAIVVKGGSRNTKVYGNIVHISNPHNAAVELGGTTGNQWLFDGPSGIECYNCEAYGNTVLSDGAGYLSYLWGFAGCSNCSIHDNTGSAGGTFLRSGGLPGSYGSTNPGSTFTNNTIDGVLVP